MSSASGRHSTHWPAKKRVTLVGALINLWLSVGKIVAGLFGQSQSLVVDGVHSASDLISDLLVLIAAHWGSRQADQNHPYGHQRIETLATAVIGALLIAVAVGFVVDSLARLLDSGPLPQPGWVTLLVAIASVAIKEWLFRYTHRVGVAVGSGLIQANAWHHRSDAISSLVVVIGLTGALAGLVWLDAVAAIVVALMVGRIGWGFLIDSLAELVDTGLSRSRIAELNALIDRQPGILGHCNLRTRRMGGRILMDVELVLDETLSLGQAHRLADAVRTTLLQEVPELAEAVVMMRPPRHN